MEVIYAILLVLGIVDVSGGVTMLTDGFSHGMVVSMIVFNLLFIVPLAFAAIQSRMTGSSTTTN